MVITIPDSVYARLEAAAKRSGQTVEAELIALVEERLEAPNDDQPETPALGFLDRLHEAMKPFNLGADVLDDARNIREVLRDEIAEHVEKEMHAHD
jgi:hypothetical protein